MWLILNPHPRDSEHYLRLMTVVIVQLEDCVIHFARWGFYAAFNELSTPHRFYVSLLITFCCEYIVSLDSNPIMKKLISERPILTFAYSSILLHSYHFSSREYVEEAYKELLSKSLVYCPTWVFLALLVPVDHIVTNILELQYRHTEAVNLFSLANRQEGLRYDRDTTGHTHENRVQKIYTRVKSITLQPQNVGLTENRQVVVGTPIAIPLPSTAPSPESGGRH